MNRIFLMIAAVIAAIAAAYLMPGKAGNTFNAFLFFCICLAIVISDIKNKIVPNEMIISGIALRCIEINRLPESIINSILFVLAALLLMIIAKKVVNAACLGAGDIKLIFMLGTFRSFSGNLYALFFACIAGIMFFLIFYRNRKTEIPFAPAIVLGWFCSFFVVQ